ncbi:DUF805 domain-containing protein [Robiginitomaculum antarcticum]|uniref:DUF805 domain-containing protein n=1 Tax=Robiginitomaculum antarcticum TaxID=437507 RepID=UPI00037295D6|nr:DUF805 domain-containing protein [Robiginitomaculum antarcticum]
MAPIDAIKTFYRRYTDFAGRSSRSEYWWFLLYYVVILIVLAMLLGNTSDMMDPATGMMGGYMALGWPALIWALLHLIGMIALMVRRTHDWGKTGWLNLLLIVPGVNFIWEIVNGVIGSEAGTNKYGANIHGTDTDTLN